MSDKEAFEIMIKYVGGKEEDVLFMMKDMIHLVGIDGTVDKLVEAYNVQGKEVPQSFRYWMRQVCNYVNNLSSQN